MGKLKNYDCHKQKYYVPQDKPKWAVLNLKQASKKIDKEKSSAKKQVLGKKARVAQKLANRKGGRGVRNPANPDFKKNLEKVSVTRETRVGLDALEPDTSPETPAALSRLTRRRRRHCSFDLRARPRRPTPPDAASRPTHPLTAFPHPLPSRPRPSRRPKPYQASAYADPPPPARAYALPAVLVTRTVAHPDSRVASRAGVL